MIEGCYGFRWIRARLPREANAKRMAGTTGLEPEQGHIGGYGPHGPDGAQLRARRATAAQRLGEYLAHKDSQTGNDRHTIGTQQPEMDKGKESWNAAKPLN